MGDPIRLERNPDWVDKKTRPTCKYAPVLVPKDQSNGAILYMKYVLKRRIEKCQELGLMRPVNSTDAAGSRS